MAGVHKGVAAAIFSYAMHATRLARAWGRSAAAILPPMELLDRMMGMEERCRRSRRDSDGGRASRQAH